MGMGTPLPDTTEHSWLPVVRNVDESSQIRSFAYAPSEKVLKITFHQGRTYVYWIVPESIYAMFLEAESKGSFFHQHIRAAFDYQRVD